MRVFAISDLHIDYDPNRQWLMGLSESDYKDDLLILAGDISDKLELLRQCFNKVSNCFKQVLYVPGNHDLWVAKEQNFNSMEKFCHIQQLADSFGISTSPYHHGELTIVPLLAWYDFTFGEASEYLQQRWMDFFVCKWGKDIDKLEAYSERELTITEYFLALNEPYLSFQNEIVISFSHFLPRIDLMPNFIPPIHQKLYPVLGTDKLDHQVRQLNATIHVYGHSHFNRHVDLEGVTYINNAYGNPGEERITGKLLKCVYETD